MAIQIWLQGNLVIGAVSIDKNILSQDENRITWAVSIKGTTKGQLTIFFQVGNQRSGDIFINVTDANNSSSGQGSTGGTGTGSNSTSNSSAGTNSAGSKGQSNTVLVDTDILREDFANEFDPNSKTGGYNISQPVIKVIIPVVSRVLSILQIIGAIVLVLSLALAGFNGVLGAGDGFSEDLNLNVSTSVNEYGNEVSGVQNLTPGALSKIIRRALIGSIILESSLTIVKIVFNICTSL